MDGWRVEVDHLDGCNCGYGTQTGTQKVFLYNCEQVIYHSTMGNRNIDLESMGVDVRAGTLSLREIGRKHGCSETYVRKVMKREKWQRDLSDKVRERTRIKLLHPDIKLPSEQEIVEKASDTCVEVLTLQRTDIQRLRALELKLLAELGDPDNPPTKVHISSYQGQVTQTVLGITITERASALGQLAFVQSKRIALERQAYSLNDAPATDPYADLSRDEIERRLVELEKRR